MNHGILSDREIRRLAESSRPMIQPFEPRKVREVSSAFRQCCPHPKHVGRCNIATYDGKGNVFGACECLGVVPFYQGVGRKVVSFGCSSFGYDVRVADEFRVFSPTSCAIVDPKAFDERALVTVKGPECLIPPNSFALSRSVEKFDIPRDVFCLIFGKSTYARCGILVGMTPAEPGWRGHLTIEISNTTPLPARIHANEGICQVIFFRAQEPCEDDYGADGRYQDQGPEVVLPRA